MIHFTQKRFASDIDFIYAIIAAPFNLFQSRWFTFSCLLQEFAKAVQVLIKGKGLPIFFHRGTRELGLRIIQKFLGSIPMQKGGQCAMGFAKEYFLGLRREFRMFQDLVQVINEYRAILPFYSLDLLFEAVSKKQFSKGIDSGERSL